MKLGDWQVSAFCDNLFNSHTVLNYAQVQIDSFNPAGPPTPQENNFTFRPRTIGITGNASACRSERLRTRREPSDEAAAVADVRRPRARIRRRRHP